jgi:hypothetical protein
MFSDRGEAGGMIDERCHARSMVDKYSACAVVSVAVGDTLDQAASPY